MKTRKLAERLYAVAAMLAVVGIGLTLSIIFAGAGIALLGVSVVLFLAGIGLQLSSPARAAVTRHLESAARSLSADQREESRAPGPVR